PLAPRGGLRGRARLRLAPPARLVLGPPALRPGPLGLDHLPAAPLRGGSRRGLLAGALRDLAGPSGRRVVGPEAAGPRVRAGAGGVHEGGRRGVAPEPPLWCASRPIDGPVAPKISWVSYWLWRQHYADSSNAGRCCRRWPAPGAHRAGGGGTDAPG